MSKLPYNELRVVDLEADPTDLVPDPVAGLVLPRLVPAEAVAAP